MSLRQAINDKHEVDANGNVFSITRFVRYRDKCGNWRKRLHKGKILSQQKDNQGYPTISLDGKRFRVHRLIANAFVLNPCNHPVVNHLDGDKANNSSENLEWTTQRDNLLHAFETGLLKPKITITQGQVDDAKKLIAIGISQTKAAAEVGMSQAYLSMIINKAYTRKRTERLNA